MTPEPHDTLRPDRSSPSPDVRDLLGARSGLGAGHNACVGCPMPSVTRLAIHLARERVGVQPVVTAGAGCLPAVSAMYPQNAWRVPYLHTSSARTSAVALGLEAAWRARHARGEIPSSRSIRILVFGGGRDGASDPELPMSRADSDRGWPVTFIWYHDGAFAERFLSCPKVDAEDGPADGPPSLPGPFLPDTSRALIARGFAYVAQASSHHHEDLVGKLIRALQSPGPSFVHVLAHCPVACAIPLADERIRTVERAVACGLWPLYEWDEGGYRVSYRPDPQCTVHDYLAGDVRYQSLPTPVAQTLRHRLERYRQAVWAPLHEGA